MPKLKSRKKRKNLGKLIIKYTKGVHFPKHKKRCK